MSQQADYLQQLEFPVRLEPDANKWTLRHLALIVLTSLGGLVFFIGFDSHALLAIAAGILFAYSLGKTSLATPLAVPVLVAILAQDLELAAVLVPSAALLAFIAQFTKHYVYFQTASPVSPAVSRVTRKRVCLLRYGIVFGVYAFLAYLLTGLPPETRVATYSRLTVAIAHFVPLVAGLYVLLPPYNKLSTFWRALREWFSYNSQNIEQAGIFVSPAGPASRRITVIYLVAFLSTYPIAQASMASLADMYGVGSAELPPRYLFSSLVLFRPGLWLTPVIAILSSTFLLTSPLLCRARRVARDASGEEFDSYMQRLDLMKAGAR